MFLLGLTGSIGTGKSTVSKHLRSRGIAVIDSDRIARDVVRPQTRCWQAIHEHFGPDVIDSETQELDRQVLGAIIFDQPEKRLVLNRITHPAIQREMLKQIMFYLLTFHSFVVLDIPLLFEVSRMTRYVSYIIVVWCQAQQQQQRVALRDGFDHTQVERRIQAQISIDEKRRLADFVIDNSGSIESTRLQVDRLLDSLRYPKAFYIVRAGLILIYITLAVACFQTIRWCWCQLV